MIRLASLAGKPGRFGCRYHPAVARKLGIDLSYQPFAVDDFESAVRFLADLGVRGISVSMPFKRRAAELPAAYVSPYVQATGAANTIVIKDGLLYCYNTDYSGLVELFDRATVADRRVVVVGSGALAETARAVLKAMSIPSRGVTGRDVFVPCEPGELVFNCTPLKRTTPAGVGYLDCGTDTPGGLRLALVQGYKQFELYTGVSPPDVCKTTDFWTEIHA